MPSAAKRQCAQPGCPELVERGRCPKHQAAKHKGIDARRGSSTERGYDTDWRRLRAYVLRNEPLCRECRQNERLEVGVEVDHIIPIGDGGKRLDQSNLQPLCKPCHSRKTMNEQNAKRGYGSWQC